MTVEPIQGHNRRHSVFAPMTEGAAYGVVGGYIAKYALPITKEEKNTKEYRNAMSTIDSAKTAFNDMTQENIDKISKKINRTLVEDEYVKMFDGMKQGDQFKQSRIRTAINNINEKDSSALPEFRKICKQFKAQTKDYIAENVKYAKAAYDLVTKHIRPTSFFVVAGAVVGAFVAMINDILKTDVKKH